MMATQSAAGDGLMEERVFQGFEKNSTEQVVGLIQPFKGRWLAHVRVAVSSRDGDELIPTRKGVAIEVSRFKELRDAVHELGNVASREKVVARIEQTKRTEIRVGVNEFKGDILCYVRTFYKDGAEEEWKPGKGLSLRVDQIEDLEQLVDEMGAALDSQ